MPPYSKTLYLVLIIIVNFIIHRKNKNMELIFEGQTCKAELIPEKKRVFYTLEGYSKPEEHKEMYLKVFELMKTRPVVTFMHDMKQMKGTFTQLNDWLVETFRPAVELGFRCGALILNDDVFTAFAASDIMKKVQIVQLQVFKAQEEAEKWLDEELEE